MFTLTGTWITKNISIDFFNRNQTILSMDQCASNKAVLAGDATSDEPANGTPKETICSAVNSSFKSSVPATSFDATLNGTGNCATNGTRNRALCSTNGCTSSEAGNTARSYSSNSSTNNQGCANRYLSWNESCMTNSPESIFAVTLHNHPEMYPYDPEW